MLPRLVTHSCRGLLSHSAKNVALFQQTVTGSSRGLSHSAKNVAQKKVIHGHIRRPSVDELTPNVSNSIALAGVSAFGLAALAFYGKQQCKEETNVIVDSTIFPQYVRDRMTSAYACRLASVAVALFSVIAVSRFAQFVKFAASLSVFRGQTAVFLGSFAAAPLAATISDSKPFKWIVTQMAHGVPIAVFCLNRNGPLMMGCSLCSAGISAGLAIAAMTAPSENFLLTTSGPLAMLLGAICACSIGCCFLPPVSSLGARDWPLICAFSVLYAASYYFRAQSDTKKVSEIPRPFNPFDYGL